MKWLCLAFLLMATYSDIRTRKIPNVLLFIGMLAGIMGTGMNGVYGILVAIAVCYVFIVYIEERLGFTFMGGGDAKLLAMLGSFVGVKHLLVIMVASMLIAFLALAFKRLLGMTNTLPYAPFVLAVFLLIGVIL